MFEEYAEEKGWTSPEAIPDERVWDEMDFQDREHWCDVKGELQSLFDESTYLLTGTCGRWNGPAQGGKFIRSIYDLLSCIQHLECIRIYDKGGHLHNALQLLLRSSPLCAKGLRRMKDYGYTVRYRKYGTDKWKVYLVTNTYALAEWHVRWYERDSPKGLLDVTWDVFPIRTLSEYKIRWRGCPF